MDIRALASFYHVVQSGSFSAAADKLNVSKGMLSRHVTALERSLNAQLLQRSTRALSLTETGKAMYQTADEIFALLHQTEASIHAMTEEDSGRLRFTSPVSLGDRLIPELLKRFSEQCPRVRVELNFTNQPLDMRQGENDIALRAIERVPEDLVALPLGRLKDVVVASPAFLLRYPEPSTPYGLSSLPCILHGNRPDWETWHFRQSQEEMTINALGSVQVNHHSTAIQLALSGAGVVKCPLLLVESLLTQKRLQQILPHWETSLHTLFILHAQQRNVPRKLQIFKQIIKEWFAEHSHYLAESLP